MSWKAHLARFDKQAIDVNRSIDIASEYLDAGNVVDALNMMSAVDLILGQAQCECRSIMRENPIRGECLPIINLLEVQRSTVWHRLLEHVT